MGAGNYWLDDAETVYIDCDTIYGEDDSDTYYQFLEFIEQITSLIPLRSFYAVQNQIHNYQESRFIIAENAWYQISIVEWHTYFAINVELKPNHYMDSQEFNPLAIYHHAAIAKKIFDALAKYFDLRVRTCGWTSGPYILA